MTRIDIKLRKNAGIIEIWDGSSWLPTTLAPDMKLANRLIPDVKSLLDSYLDADFLTNSEWDLRVSEQRKIGAALRKSIFGERQVDVGNHLRFVPVRNPTDPEDDAFIEFLSRIPWTMLTRTNDPGNGFLAFGLAKPVAITVDAAPLVGERPAWQAVRLPTAPRLLLVMPEVRHRRVRENTGAAQHRDSLLRILKPHYEGCGHPDHIKCVRTFSEYRDALIENPWYPEIIYFYGHGASAGKGTMFQFEDEAGREAWHGIDELIFGLDEIVAFTHRPPLIWFNACLGAAASQESALREFSKTASCVVAMRTVVRVDASQLLAEKALKAIIIDGFSPPVAIRETLSKCPSDWMRSGHWASIAVAEQYVDWTAVGDTKDTAGANDAVGDFPSRVDRREALEDITELLASSFVDSLAVSDPTVLLWAGSDQERPVQFAERTRDVITEKFQGFRPIYIDVDLQQGVRPGSIDELKVQLRAAIMIGLDNGSMTKHATNAEIMAALGRVSPGQRGVLTFFHGPLTARHAGLVHIYIELWKTICRELSLARNPTKIALAFGFVSELNEPLVLPKGRDAIRLGAVAPAEIRTHLSRYRLLYGVDLTELDDKTALIHRTTDGVFSRLVDTLRDLAGFKTIRKEGEINGGL
ncbi:hypothetical protein IE4771_PE00090 (plasmid) [Rhizobium etli bv. mimosae str. IE4771]|uniref:CHAT domain-containing protein n=1 Tax=Rhizobium etli bv. mimosae str. IE4771 TaxID=1432050 RepID=A0A060II90_RHIET|nr:hypothetical protein [Rhizobium sp. IE4771]AIC31316.1 hypothetical protein IE4771_PE00090 [Rhizobium sp. IE4771]